MGFPEEFQVPAVGVDGPDVVGHFYRGIGNAVTPPVIEAIGAELLRILRIFEREGGDGRGSASKD
eukprot:CAMPEP_0183314598 /NCGR_PEP_ID=MMETSP0160_2-20130417/48978_1 /TAXON_ID=2839 ORGANISM="Odontella Sinensis, Strain Grunow 1884" /NCGR_SAMPLE_ID=MMETSP0160_2 /ASSEMBLY_ACC=CAM_ASM_000250 /LENGTH=64 /DNA_ID=CAMNT_0025479973 /DNA_START=57 /DNA_END=251 /DNA_ORIENTATION=+